MEKKEHLQHRFLCKNSERVDRVSGIVQYLTQDVVFSSAYSINSCYLVKFYVI